MQNFLVASVVTEDGSVARPAVDKLKTLVLQIQDDGSWAGVVRVMGRITGSSGAFHAQGARNTNDEGLVISGTSGMTAAGIYKIPVEGLEIYVQHTRSAGTLTAFGEFTTS